MLYKVNLKDYKPTPVYEVPKNHENNILAMSEKSEVQEEKAKMRVSYIYAEFEYKNGKIKEGDVDLEEGRRAAERAHRAINKEAEVKFNKYNDEYLKAYHRGDMTVAREYSEKLDNTMSYVVKEHQKLDEEKIKYEEKAKTQKESFMKAKL